MCVCVGGACERVCAEGRGHSFSFFSHACHSPIKQLKFVPRHYPAAVARSDCDRHACVFVNMHEAVCTPHQLLCARARTRILRH